jgi:16S rRNA (guanine527-N7)-methyltransferase
MDAHSVAEHLTALGIDFSSAQQARAAEFARALYAANEVKNLTRVPREEFWTRHFLDSVLFADQVPRLAVVLDIGTGPGFPAWPLALVRPDLTVVALDSNGKMLDFLRGHPLPNLNVVQSRAEEWRERERFDWVTGRAAAPLEIFLEISASAAKVGGVVAPLRSAGESATFDLPFLGQLGLGRPDVFRRNLPPKSVERCLPVYPKQATTPRKYPRRWSEILARPLGRAES